MGPCQSSSKSKQSSPVKNREDEKEEENEKNFGKFEAKSTLPKIIERKNRTEK